jgi:hypothetical protein
MMPDAMTNHDDFSEKEIYELKFPDELYGAVIDNIDVTILALDSIRLIEAYAKQGGELSEIQWQVLRQCDDELQTIAPQLQGYPRGYFHRLHQALKETLKSL